jgi:hypothetical protein
MIGQPLAALALAAFTAAHPAAHAAESTSTPSHLAPVRMAWYDVARPTAATPAAPVPGVGPHDLLVQGFTVTTSQLPLALPPLPPIKQVTAFAALTYRLPKGTSPASLTLKLSGFNTAKIVAKLPSGASPIACIATDGFKTGGDQPASAAPKYDCTKRSIVGQLNAHGDAIVFPGVSRLVDKQNLSLVVLPGSLGVERLVFSKPAKSSLSLLRFLPTSPATSTAVPPVPPSPSRPSVTGSVPGPGAPAPTVPVPAVSSIAVPPVPASAPSVAPTTRPQALISAAKPIDDTRARTGAIGGLVFLLVVTAWLVASRPKPATEFGVGKFRAARNGPPPAI